MAKAKPVPQDALLYIVRHTGLHYPFGEDEGLAKEGEIYTEDQILDHIDQTEFDRLIALEAIEEPTPREIKAWREAQAAALLRQKALLAEIAGAQDAIAETEDELEESDETVSQTALELEEERTKNAALATQVSDLTKIVKQLQSAAKKEGAQATSPAAAKGKKNPNPATTANPEKQAENISGNQTSDDPNLTGTQVQETVVGDQSGGVGNAGATA